MIHSISRKGEAVLGPKKRNLKARGQHSLQAMKSMSADCRISGVPETESSMVGFERIRTFEAVKCGPDNGTEADCRSQIADRGSDDSPYGRNFAVIEREDDGELTGKPLYFPLSNELSWSDHSVFGAKKVALLLFPATSLRGLTSCFFDKLTLCKALYRYANVSHRHILKRYSYVFY